MSRREVLSGEVSIPASPVHVQANGSPDQMQANGSPDQMQANGSPAKCRQMEVLPNAGKWNSCPIAGKCKS